MIKRRGSVVIKDVVPDEQATGWKDQLREFVTKNPDVDGKPPVIQFIDWLLSTTPRRTRTRQAILQPLVRLSLSPRLNLSTNHPSSSAGPSPKSKPVPTPTSSPRLSG